jgi:hypothetical protein
MLLSVTDAIVAFSVMASPKSASRARPWKSTRTLSFHYVSEIEVKVNSGRRIPALDHHERRRASA